MTYSCPRYLSYVVLPWSLARHSVLSLNRRFLVSDWNKQNLLGQSLPPLPNRACVKREDTGERRAGQESARVKKAKDVSSRQDRPWETVGRAELTSGVLPLPWPNVPCATSSWLPTAREEAPPRAAPRPLATPDLALHHLTFLLDR